MEVLGPKCNERSSTLTLAWDMERLSERDLCSKLHVAIAQPLREGATTRSTLLASAECESVAHKATKRTVFHGDTAEHEFWMGLNGVPPLYW